MKTETKTDGGRDRLAGGAWPNTRAIDADTRGRSLLLAISIYSGSAHYKYNAHKKILRIGMTETGGWTHSPIEMRSSI